ncbi:hypothetical protein [Subtercola boreus]|uniref:hypothetical protein n=1 Tax=Subtercola boreus TaxID=120213 RepID=UPI001150E082|nr:hypothetical protein [Subtercola boreus]
MTNFGRADAALDYNSLTYRDQTGERAMRNLAPGQYQITHESGLRFWIDADELRPLLSQCYVTESRRSGYQRLHLKKNAPESASTDRGQQSQPNTHEPKE